MQFTSWLGANSRGRLTDGLSLSGVGTRCTRVGCWVLYLYDQIQTERTCPLVSVPLLGDTMVFFH